MDYFIRFEYWWVLPVTLSLVAACIWYKWRWPKAVYYRHSLGTLFKLHKKATNHPYKKIFYVIRFITLFALAFLIAKPQLVDSHSNIITDGIDIMVVLDASGSMEYRDFGDQDRSRFDVAKAEAIRFINKRTNDAIGLVLFGKDAISRSPLTMDKKILNDMVARLRLGDIDPDGTMLATAMVTAINRLKNSEAKSKIMILLTDGEPSEGDMDPIAACTIAKKLGIKIYTVGLGSEEDHMVFHPLYGHVPLPKVNAPLLKDIARKTNGKFFMAHDAKDMRAIYDTIDRLETTKHEAPLYSNYFDLYAPITLGIFVVVIVQLFLSSFVWFSI